MGCQFPSSFKCCSAPRRLWRSGTLARAAAWGVSVQQKAALSTVDARMPREAVLYTTIAAVNRRRQDRAGGSLAELDVEVAMPSAMLEATRTRLVSPPCTWQPVSRGAWAQVHVCVEIEEHTSEARFRIIAWILDSGRVVVNDILGVGCRWWRSACDDAAFRRLTGLNCHTYGFQFRSTAKATECSRIVGRILANVPGVLKVVKKLMLANINLQGVVMAWQGFGLHSIHYPSRTPRIYSEKTPSSSSSRVVEKSLNRTVYYPKEQEATSPFAEDQQQQEVGSSSNDGAAFHDELNYCKLAQGQGNASSVEGGEDCNQTVLSSRVPTSPVALLETHGGSDMETPVPEKKRSRGEWISRPYKMWGETHVTYNAEFARYEGLPAEWRELNHQFGLPLEVVLKREVEGYESKLPAVLVMMKTCFLAHNGARTEGVFRLAPDKQEYSAVKHSINNGTFEDCADVHIMASLIKVWFRELPVGLFNMLPDSHISRACNFLDPEPKVVLRTLEALPTLHQSVVLWLLDLLNEIVKYEHENKMTAKSMAIVMAPNLLSVKNADAAVVVAAYRQVAEFVQALLHARLEQRVSR